MKRTLTKAMAFAIISLAMLFSGCQKDLYDPNTSTTDTDAPITGVPDDFDWSTVSSVNLTVNVDDQYNGAYYYTVEVYDKNPIISSDAKLLTKGVGKQGSPFVSVVTVPQTLKSLVIRQTNPAGISVVRSIDVDSNSLTCSFGETSATTKSSSVYRATKTATLAVTDADFPTSAPAGATNFNPASFQASSNYILPDGFSGQVSLGNQNNISLYASGTVHISYLYLTSGSKLYLLPGATVTSDSNNLGQVGAVISINTGASFITTQTLEASSSVKLLNKGTFQAPTLKISTNAQLYNAGTITVSGKLSGENSDSYIENNGTITAQDLETAGSSSFVNSGNVTIANKTYISSSGATWKHESGTYTTKNMEIISGNSNSTNSCKLVVTNELKLNTGNLNIDAGAYVSCNTLYMDNARIEMKALAMLDVKEQANYNYNIPPKGIFGVGNVYALLKIKKAVSATRGVDATSIINYGGKLQIACSDHPDQYVNPWNKRYDKEPSVEWVNYDKATVDIPSSACTAGNDPATGNPPVNPTFPMDVTDGTSYTYAMEDLWPAYGDYDMNDIVISNTFGHTLSSQNYISKLTITTTLQAIGANKSIAAAFQLDNISSANVTGVTYSVSSTDGSVFEVANAKVESGQTKAVIPLFDNAHSFLGVSAGSITNTVESGTYVAPKTVVVTVTFVSNTVTAADIAVKDLNFFIVTDGKKTSRTEVHLGGYNPTDKVNTALFNTGVDASGTNGKYKSKGNLVWGMMLPTAFEYPIESTSILDVYSKFEPWAVSGGTSDVDWYLTPTNTASVYKKN